MGLHNVIWWYTAFSLVYIRLEALYCTPRLFTWGFLRIAVADRGVGVRAVVHLVTPLWYCATGDFFCSASAFRSASAERRFFNFLYFRQILPEFRVLPLFDAYTFLSTSCRLLLRWTGLCAIHILYYTSILFYLRYVDYYNCELDCGGQRTGFPVPFGRCIILTIWLFLFL